MKVIVKKVKEWIQIKRIIADKQAGEVRRMNERDIEALEFMYDPEDDLAVIEVRVNLHLRNPSQSDITNIANKIQAIINMDKSNPNIIADHVQVENWE